MIPLSDRMRPGKLTEIIGQKHILSPESLLTKSIRSGQIFSMIFWGPPGVGKTTLARVIAKEVNTDFLEFSAVNTGTAELKKIFGELDPTRQTIVFIDEIHRFSKSQQDAFLPFVERGVITLIGATTENPSFEIIAPLLSRSRVFVLKQLTKEELEQVVNNALKDKENGLGKYNAHISPNALDFLLEESNGDARKILNTLEIAVSSSVPVIARSAPDEAIPSMKKIASGSLKPRYDEITIDQKIIEEAMQKKALMYDKAGEEHYNTISAFIKSMRASNADAALYYLARMVSAGEDPLFIARRMVIFASEDIGMAQPTALVVANEVFRACETIGYPECQINLAHGVVYLAKAKKDRTSYEAYFKALEDVQTHGNLPIPMNLRNAPTKLMKDLGYGEGYKKYSKEDLLPEKLKGKKYFIEKSEG
jgi:putative ATPase